MIRHRLTRPLLEAMQAALNAALAGGGFDGGDFDGENREHFERALEWVQHRLKAHYQDHAIEDADNGQDRESYSDTQDRDSYSCDTEEDE